MNTPPLGMITVPHWEWWLHHNPFRRYCEGGRTCRICESDTGCNRGCPKAEIDKKIEEIVALMRQWEKRLRYPERGTPVRRNANGLWEPCADEEKEATVL